MEALEGPAIVVVLVCVVVVVGVKRLTASTVANMRHDIGRVTQVKKETLGRLKQAQSQTYVARKSVAGLEQTKRQLARRAASLRKELRDIGQEERARRVS